MSKNFIRHLEFYGYPDQNEYTSGFFEGCGVDLSDIVMKNEEQDEEIQDLTDEKADKKDLNALSGKVDSIITLQSEINQEFAGAISGNTDRINTIAEKVDEISDAVNDVMDNMQILDDKIDGVADDLAELSGKVETLSAETEDAISGISQVLDEKLDKQEADDKYADKDDVYTKDEVDSEIDEKLEPYATKDWVEALGYMTQEDADERYATKESVNALSGKVDDVESELNGKIEATNENLDILSSITITKFDEVNTAVENLNISLNDKIGEVSGSVASLYDRVGEDEAAIADIETELAKKADKTDLEALEVVVSGLSEEVSEKVDKTEFNEYKSFVANEINELDAKKADKTDLLPINERIDDAEEAISQERDERISGDTYITNIISGINVTIEEIQETEDIYGEKIADLEDGLAEEIRNRKQADIDIIGTDEDTKDDDTVWGAKKYALYQKGQAVFDANEYTDSEIRSVRSEVEAQFNNVEMELTGKASKEYVDESRNELKSELQSEIANSVEAEKDRAQGEETNLLLRILANTSGITENDSAIDLLANRVNAITAWDGTNPDEYVNTGNGVLDVLHREFHSLIEILTQKGILP